MSDHAQATDQRLRRRPGWLRPIEHYEQSVLVILALVVGSIWGFVELADEVTEGDTNAFDQSLLLALRNPNDLSDPIAPRWVEGLCQHSVQKDGC